MPYKYGVLGVNNDPEEPSFNALVFDTPEEAYDGGNELLSRWFVPTGFDVVWTDEPANYYIEDGVIGRINERK
jgi:hypothetical protein|tara:strand:+ start:1549 stop:1767 length:219 start_codon:yes stop_codon:yes gene_type:complete